MRRREFVGMAAGAMAASALPGCAPRGAASGAAVSATGTTGAAPLDALAFHAERRYVALDVGRIAYVERGTGRDAALFLHGFPLNAYQWRGALERLAAYRRCIAPDFLGLGFTQPADGASLAPDAQAAMLVALLDRLGVGAVDVVANDSGGAVAQLLAVRHPGRVRTMLLTNCDTEPDCPPPALQPVIELAKAGEFTERWLAPWVADKALARSAEGLGGMTFTHPTNPSDEAIDYYLGPLVASPRRKALTHGYAIALERNALAGIERELRRSRIPTRVVWGTGDTIFSPEAPDYLDRVLGNSKGVLRVAGAKLFFPEEYPDLIAAEAKRLWGMGEA